MLLVLPLVEFDDPQHLGLHLGDCAVEPAVAPRGGDEPLVVIDRGGVGRCRGLPQAGVHLDRVPLAGHVTPLVLGTRRTRLPVWRLRGTPGTRCSSPRRRGRGSKTTPPCRGTGRSPCPSTAAASRRGPFVLF